MRKKDSTGRKDQEREGHLWWLKVLGIQESGKKKFNSLILGSARGKSGERVLEKS